MDISVIIPVYNTEKYLPSCIDSILAQTNVSFEIILVDDGSTDMSSSICDTYASKHNNIIVYHINNSGPATARNKGFNVAQGEYVTFTDSDDKMEPLMLYKMITAGKEHNADIICCNYKEIDEEGNMIQASTFDEKTNKVFMLKGGKVFSRKVTKINSLFK